MEKTLMELKQELVELKAELESKQKEAENWEVGIDDEQYDDMLDDVYGEVQIAGCSYSTSYALKKLDPTAYRCGKSDFESGMDNRDDPKYQELQEEIEELESNIADLEERIELEEGGG
jgi:DNA repair exonuclease SbcCD ATPase subunit